MQLLLGSVTNSYGSEGNFRIKFTVPTYVKDAVADPLNETDEPNIGDPVMILDVDPVNHTTFFYTKLRVFNHTRFKFKSNMIDIKDNGINIITGSGNKVNINGDGGINITSSNNVNINSSKTININSSDEVVIKGSAVTIDSSTVEMPTGSVAPTGSGPFCAIPVCPYNGQPHVGNYLA